MSEGQIIGHLSREFLFFFHCLSSKNHYSTLHLTGSILTSRQTIVTLLPHFVKANNTYRIKMIEKAHNYE